MRALLPISTYLLISFCSFSQNNTKIDSLKTQLQKELPDTTRIKTLNDLGWELQYQTPDTAILLGKQALELAEIAEHKKSIANSHNNLGAYYRIKGDYPISLSYNFKALEIRKQLKDNRGIANSLSKIGNVYSSQGNYPKALKHYFKALEIMKEMENKNGIAAILGNIGLVYFNQGDYPIALKHFFEALK